jgi:hypothetical protein
VHDIDTIVTRVAADDFDKLQLASKKPRKTLADFETILRPPAADDVCYSLLFSVEEPEKSKLIGCPPTAATRYIENARDGE